MNQHSETWRPVPGFKGMYEVSDHGNVRSLDRVTTGPSGVRRKRRGRMMRLNLSSSNGYVMVQLCNNGTTSGKNVHRLVALAFLDVPADFESLHVRHYDGNKLNNHVSNLSWGTPLDNYMDMQRQGRANWHVPRPAQKVCKRGHEMTPDNTWEADGKRRCRTCAKFRARHVEAKKRVDWLRGELITAETELMEAKRLLG